MELNLLMSFSGGLLIGIASSIMLIFSGKIAGVSGIFGGMLFEKGEDKVWRIYFVLGLILGGIILNEINVDFFENSTGRDLFEINLAGFLVGIGTRISGGCTSGHGVCGIGRVSGRSIAATFTFVLTGMVIVNLLKSFLY